MNNTSTFQFLFYDLLTRIDKCQIEYGYKVIAQDIELKSGAIIREGYYWDLDIWKVCGSITYTAFHNDISRITKNTINEIKNDSFELAPTLPFLSQKIEEKTKTFQLLLEWDETQMPVLNDLLGNHEIEFIFQGYQDYLPDIYENYENPARPDIGPNNYPYLIKKLKPYFDLVSQELNRISSFLSHLQDLNQIKLDKIDPSNSSTKKSKLMALAQKGKISELISFLERNDKISSNQLFINLSARWHQNEEMKKMDLINHADYNLVNSNLINLSISVINSIEDI